MRPYPTATQPQFKLNHKSGGRGKCAAHGSSANHAKQIGRTSPAFHRTDFATHPARPRTDSPAFYRTNFARAPARQSDGLTFGIPSPAFPRTDFARIRKADADSTISQPRYGRNQPPLNHDSTILSVEYKNDTISTKPSYISDSPNQTAIQPHSNLNQKKLAQDRPFRVLCKRSAI